jgi:hypothetical protein
MCRPHLDLARRSDYPVRRVEGAGPVERSLLDAYAVDPLPLRMGAAA